MRAFSKGKLKIIPLIVLFMDKRLLGNDSEMNGKMMKNIPLIAAAFRDPAAGR